MRLLLLVAAVTACSGFLGASGGNGVRDDVRGPRWFAEAAFVYDDFDGTDRPRTASDVEVIRTQPRTGERALIGHGANTTDAAMVLRSPRFSPHRPWTLSFWWSLPHDLPEDGSFGKFSLIGKGYVGAFVRGKGEWCALQRPAGVLQVYYFPGIQNVNNIYDDRIATTMDLRKGVWHHTAVVFRMGAIVDLYADGMKTASIAVTGRSFLASDDMRHLEIGGGVIIDELAALDRAVSPQNIHDYVAGMRRIAEYMGP